MKIESLNFEEVTELIYFLDEYSKNLKYEKYYEKDILSDEYIEKIDRKIKSTDKIKDKVEKEWKSNITVVVENSSITIK